MNTSFYVWLTVISLFIIGNLALLLYSVNKLLNLKIQQVANNLQEQIKGRKNNDLQSKND